LPGSPGDPASGAAGSGPSIGGGPGNAGGPSGIGGGPPPGVADPARPRFPWLRLLYAIGFAVVAWVMFWLIVLLLAPLHFITVAITGRPNDELKHMSLRAVHYLVELLVYVTGARDEMPFPLGPFPKA
jgi:hypothetical protein